MLAELLDVMRVWIELIIRALGYPGIALLMLAENLFPPIPSELVMPFAGFLAARGEMHLGGVLIAGGLGSVAGAVALYLAGRWLGDRAVRPLIERYGRWLLLSGDDYDRALRVFAQHGRPAVFIGRLLPLIRSLISLPAGWHRMPWRHFLPLTLAGTTLWNGLMAGAGYALGARWDEILIFTKQYERGVLVTLAALAVGGLVVHLARRRANPMASGEDA